MLRKIILKIYSFICIFVTNGILLIYLKSKLIVKYTFDNITYLSLFLISKPKSCLKNIFVVSYVLKSV